MKPSDDMLLVMLAGQSNMAGRGAVEDEDREVVPGLFCLDREERWVPAVDPIAFDRPFAGVSPGRTFGKLLLADHPGKQVGLVPCAVGGTAISCWLPGAEGCDPDEHPYDDTLRRAQTARRSGRFFAILWHQGESDAKRRNADYETDFRALVERFRRDVDAEAPFLCGGLGDFLAAGGGGEYDFPLVEQVLRRVAGELPNMGFVSAKGLRDKGDKLHFDAASTREFGRRYYDVFRQQGKQA